MHTQWGRRESEGRFTFRGDEFMPNPDAGFFGRFDYTAYKKVAKGQTRIEVYKQ